MGILGHATSVANIARDADVGGTVSYAYFPGKEVLFFAALDAGDSVRP
jgi:AcrR family transcriptional regulator